MTQSIFIFLLGLTFSVSAQTKKLTLEEIWGKWEFSSETVSGINSMNDGQHYTSLESTPYGEAIVKYEYKTGKTIDTLLKSKDLKIDKDTSIAIEDYQFSYDETKLLIATNTEHIYRHSTKEDYYIFDLKQQTLIPLTQGEKQRYATFSPEGTKVAFVRNNNIYIKDLVSTIETQVTNDGRFNEIINGSADWVYEEEFSFDKAFFWSEEGDKIAYYHFDESNVKEFSMDIYGSLYPTGYKFKYPKAGEENSKVSVRIYDLATTKTISVDLGTDFEYIPRIKWTKDNATLSIQRMNRHQNKLDFLLADATTGKTRIIFTETSKTYIDITDNLTFLNDKNRFIWTSEKNGYNHLYVYNLTTNTFRQITKGEWEVSEFKGLDEKNDILYYISTETSPLERDLFSINLDGTGKKKISTQKGTNDAIFSKNFSYFINYYSNANTPPYISLNTANGKEVRQLKDNSKLKNRLSEYNLTNKTFFSFKTSENIDLNGWMMKPVNFENSKKYPVYMFVYGGPGNQQVLNSWGGVNLMFYHYLAQQGYLVVCVDNRGTGGRGSDFKTCTYKQLGNLETQDQIEAANYLGTLEYVDKSRIGIQGWSYGGYMSSLCITKGADIFKTAIAVAPVTNWRYYDTIYTERYMQTPKENANGYDNNSPINHVEKLKGKYLLIHGTADDNVHFQNSVEMVNALIKANKQFDFYIYPDKNHSIYGGNARLHLFTKIADFIQMNL